MVSRGVRVNIYGDAESFVRSKSQELGISRSAVVTMLVCRAMRSQCQIATDCVNLAQSGSVDLTQTDTSSGNQCQSVPSLADLGEL